MEIQPSFRVADNHVMSQVAQHGKADFTCIGAPVFIKGILGGKVELTTVNLQAERLEIKHTGCKYYFKMLVYRDALIETMHQQASLMRGEVHLPVASDK